MPENPSQITNEFSKFNKLNNNSNDLIHSGDLMDCQSESEEKSDKEIKN